MEIQPKVKLTMDGMEILADPGMTILDAAKTQDIRIPTLCHHPALSAWGGCRMCVVEVDGAPRLAASCVTPVRSGMVVVTTNDTIIKSRRTMLEFLFAERNHNCMFCPQSGDCELQKLAYELQMDHLTVSTSFNKFPVDVTSEYMALDHNRCMLCGRCVRACKEIAGAAVLNYQNRGPESLIGMDLNEARETSSCLSCGVCVQVCPTGAMVNRYRGYHAVKGHVKAYRQIESVCPQCGLLCPAVVSVRNNSLLKIEGKLAGFPGRPDRGQLCYKGRFEVLKSSGKRLETPMIRTGNGTWRPADWDEALGLIAEKLRAAQATTRGEAVFGLVSSASFNEEIFLFKEFMTRACPAAHLDTFDGIHCRTVAAARQRAGQNSREASWHALPEADVVILLGTGSCRSQPLLSSLLRRHILETHQIVAVLGEADPMPAYAAYYFPVKDKALPLLIRALNPDDQRYDGTQKLLKRAGLGAADITAFREMTAALSRSKNPMFLAGVSLSGSGDAAALADVMRLAGQRGPCADGAMRLILLKPCGNSAASWMLGIPALKEPAAGIKWAGGLVLLSELDLSYAPVIEGFGRVDFIAVMSAFFPEDLADRVHVLIPKPFFMEQAGTVASLNGAETGRVQKILEAPQGIQDSHQFFKKLAARMGYQPDCGSWEQLTQRSEIEINNRRSFG